MHSLYLANLTCLDGEIGCTMTIYSLFEFISGLANLFLRMGLEGEGLAFRSSVLLGDLTFSSFLKLGTPVVCVSLLNDDLGLAILSLLYLAAWLAVGSWLRSDTVTLGDLGVWKWSAS